VGCDHTVQTAPEGAEEQCRIPGIQFCRPSGAGRDRVLNPTAHAVGYLLERTSLKIQSIA